MRLEQLIAPGRQRLRLSGRLVVCAGLLWLPQAGLVATTIGALLQPETQLLPIWLAAVLFMALGALRALLNDRAARLSFEAAQVALETERAQLIARETHRTGEDPARRPAAATATLAAEKLAHLIPFLTRYTPARARSTVLPLVILALAAWHSWAVAATLFVAGPLIPVFMALVGIAAKDASERQMEELSDMNVLLLERLVALVDIRLLDAQERATEQFRSTADRLRQRTMEVLRIAFLSSTVLELFAAIGVAMVAVYVGLSLLGELSFGSYGAPLTPAAGVFLLLLAPDYFQPLRDLAVAWHDKADAEAVAKELYELEQAETTRFVGTGQAEVAPLGGTLQARGLTRRLGQDRLIKFPDLTAQPGELVVVSGPSGAGKTTYLRLLAGLSRADSGEISLNGTALSDDNADGWRTRLGWMPQAPRFVNGSLRHNLCLSAGDNPRPLDEALELAAASEIVTRLPDGLNTRLGESGVGVSGGEARRLILARAALGRPDVLLADEPTADLDSATATQVMAGLEQLRTEGCTLIVASHDPDLIARADRALSIEVSP